jgi:hypothetical protein
MAALQILLVMHDFILFDLETWSVDLPDPNFPVENDTLDCAAIKPVHASQHAILSNTISEHQLFVGTQPFCCLWPIGHERIGKKCHTNTHTAFDDKDPASKLVGTACLAGKIPTSAIPYSH